VKIGYARISTEQQDLTAQRDALAALGVPAERVYVDHGLTGTNRERPGLREALAACRAGDELVVTKLDRLARSLPDARAIADELTERKVKLNLGGSVHDPTDPVGRLLFNVLAMVAEFEADLIRARTREGMKVAKAKAKGRLRGKQPKLSPAQEAHLVKLYAPAATPSASSRSCSPSPARRSIGRSGAPTGRALATAMRKRHDLGRAGRPRRGPARRGDAPLAGLAPDARGRRPACRGRRCGRCPAAHCAALAGALSG